MNSPTDPTPAPPLTFPLWAGILAGPVLWIANQQINYLLVYWARPTNTVAGLQLVTLACGGAVAAATAGCWVQWRQARAQLDAGGDQAWRRVAFMAGMGALMSLLFLVAIIAFALPPLFVHPAQR